MAHALTDEEYYTEETCEHGFCLDHKPEWKNIGDKYTVPDPLLYYSHRKKGFRKIKEVEITRTHSPTKKHCGQPMLLVKKVVERQCLKCGRKDFKILESDLVKCECCGYVVENRIPQLNPEHLLGY